MPQYSVPVLAAIALWNIITFSMFGLDKRKAVKKRRRISEKTLITCAFLMGGLGALAGMLVFRHKTRHWKFRVLVPVALVLNIAVIVGAAAWNWTV